MIETSGGGRETVRQSERQEGFQEERQTGEIQASYEIAVQTLQDGFDRDEVSRQAKLSAGQIDWLANEQGASN